MSTLLCYIHCSSGTPLAWATWICNHFADCDTLLFETLTRTNRVTQIKIPAMTSCKTNWRVQQDPSKSNCPGNIKLEVLSRLELLGKHMIIWNMRPIEQKWDRVRENALNSHSARRNTRAARARESHYGVVVLQKVKILFPSVCVYRRRNNRRLSLFHPLKPLSKRRVLRNKMWLGFQECVWVRVLFLVNYNI